MKILIGQSYFRILDPKEENRNMPYPPLGSLILATKLENNNNLISFFDCMLANNTDELLTFIDESDVDLFILYDDEFNYLTKMSLLNMRENTVRTIAKCKSVNLPVLVYTSDAIDHPEIYLKAGATAVIHGEGERVVEDILSNNSKLFQKNAIKLNDIPGISYYENGITIINPRLPLSGNLDDLPIPDYGKFVNIEKYRKIWIENHGYFSINISTSRGCTYGCNWCAKPLWGRTYHANSPKRIIAIFEFLQFELKVDHIWITDDIFGLKKDWLKEFSELYKKTNLTIPYKCLSRADLLLNRDSLQYLSDTNCEIIWVGAESGSQKILDAMDKGTTVQQLREVVIAAQNKNIKIAFFIQFGYLGETWDDINLTRKLIIETDPADIGISVSYPLPETKFYSMVKNHLKEKRNWTDSDDLDMMFHGTFTRDFYKLLHKQVHNQFRFRKYLKKKNFIKSAFHGMKYFYYSISLRRMNKHPSVTLLTVEQ